MILVHFRSVAAAATFIVASLLPACTSNLNRGILEYQKGNYPTAIENLRSAEPSRSEPGRARYALYRGLTHLALGDQESAVRWLAEAKMYLDTSRDLFDSRERGQLLEAWQRLGHSPGTWGSEVLVTHGWQGNLQGR